VTATSSDSLEDLAPFVGEWRILAALGDDPGADVGARVTFEWLAGGRFLIERWEIPIPEAPDGIAIIGADPDSEGNCLQHYFDSRGVARVYKMSLEDGVWKALARRAGFLGSTRPPASGRGSSETSTSAPSGS